MSGFHGLDWDPRPRRLPLSPFEAAERLLNVREKYRRDNGCYPTITFGDEEHRLKIEATTPTEDAVSRCGEILAWLTAAGVGVYDVLPADPASPGVGLGLYAYPNRECAWFLCSNNGKTLLLAWPPGGPEHRREIEHSLAGVYESLDWLREFFAPKAVHAD